ncbi:hypothetical protein M8A51_02830 [Schlegelella sp. S2-27]|uniref:Uncharacterized protein n=1 Tax=Caldimonas mangrovi TaxID=2944811 RepID=A0ABT0YIA8_9BURK|nr:hypothetical protein [Caldimonas mangrovi]MCM5678462.1 hypothetical protein [Caldimonas mangrovi]
MASSASVEPSHAVHPRQVPFLRAARRAVVDRWQGLPPAWRAPRTLYSLGFVLALCLLLAFHQVLTQAVQRAEARQVASANRAGAMTRCTALPDVELRQPCQARALAGIVPAEPPLVSERMAQAD